MNATESRGMFELWARGEGYDVSAHTGHDLNPYINRDTRNAWAGWEHSRGHSAARIRGIRQDCARQVKALKTPALLDVRRLGEAIAQPHCVRGKECACLTGDLPQTMCHNWWTPL